MSKETWIVVANSTHARIFQLDKLQLIEMNGLVHPEGRMHERDLSEGRSQGSIVGGGTRTFTMGPSHPPKKVEAGIFAKQVAEHIGHARASGRLERIFLAASPNFLGLLREELDSHTANLIVHEIPKDITHMQPEEIRSYFPIGL